MGRIRQLSASVINKIAAGEVIERPASVVKELLENAVDAGATRVLVEAAAGGSELIRLVDDGAGIHPDDLLLAVTSHATSKIVAADDLFQVSTMGFRGEALASIAEISRFRIRSRCADHVEGAELNVELGIPGEVRPCGCPLGTTIEVRDLFASTPVRRKFMKGAATEFGYLSEQFTRIALANPRMHLTLRHNDKTVYDLPATPSLLERLELFYGRELTDQLIAVESEQDGVRMWGLVGKPSLHKATRKSQHLYLNGRWIQDRTLQHALTEAYRGLMMVGRHPVSFLFIEAPADRVDVNVHPTKVEVRFQDTSPLFRQLLKMLRGKFLTLDLQSTLSLPDDLPASYRPGAGPEVRQQQLALQQEFASWAQDELTRPTHERYPEPVFAQAIPWPVEPAATAVLDDDATFAPSVTVPVSDLSRGSPSVTSAAELAPVPAQAPPAAWTAVARALQVHQCYLVVETEAGVTIYDQHALHERILYEQFRRRILAGPVESQRLLTPQVHEVSPREAAILQEYASVLEQLGFGVEEFGQQSVLINRVPVLAGRTDARQLVRDLAERLDAQQGEVTREALLDSLLALMACKAAIKQGQRLTAIEIDAMLAQRLETEDSHHCPHGRPASLTLTKAELDRQFGRLGAH